MNEPVRLLYLFSLVTILLVCTFSPGTSFAEDVPGCGNLANAYGPYDYNDVRYIDNLRLVEVAHFTEPVEMLVRGQTSTRPGHDLDYTLRAFPNHHRALYSIVKYQLDNPGGPPPEAHYTAECYLMRAIAFRPDDGAVRLIYGIYMAKTGNNDEALTNYKKALELSPESAEVQYNLGLLYLQMKQYGNALFHAHEAYDKNYPLQGLKEKLKSLGQWK